MRLSVPISEEVKSFLNEIEKACRMADIDYVPLAHQSEPGHRDLELPRFPVCQGPVGPAERGTSSEEPVRVNSVRLGPGFCQRSALYALAAAGVPVLIHLLNRRRFKEVTWAAMQFLLAAVRKNRRRIRVEQWLLAGDPDAGGDPGGDGDGQAVSRDVRRGDRRPAHPQGAGARQFAQHGIHVGRIEPVRPGQGAGRRSSSRIRGGGDAVSVILMGSPPKVVIGDPSSQPGRGRKEIDELTVSYGGTDLAATFEAIDRVLEVSPIDQKEVVFLTDLQAASWRPPGRGGATRSSGCWRKSRTGGSRWVVIDLGKAGGENRAVTELELAAPLVSVGTTAIIRDGPAQFRQHAHRREFACG